MSVEVSNVEPKEVLKNFVLLNEVPRPSKNEDRVIEFLISFATKNIPSANGWSGNNFARRLSSCI